MLDGTGIYAIRHRASGKVYVGSAARSFHKRKLEHFRDLKGGRHKNPYLQAAWNKYGRDDFEFVILEECTPEECLPREQQWIDRLKAIDGEYGYNLCAVAGSRYGVRLSEELKARISKSMTGKTRSAAHCANISRGQRGRKHSPESVAKHAAAIRGRKMSADLRARLSEIHKQLPHDRHFHKLNPEDVLEIRRLLKEGRPQKALAARYSVSDSAIRSIRIGRTWGWLADPAQ